MRVLFRLALCSTLLTWCAMAQRGGHSGGFGHGGVSLGSRGGGFSGARGGFGGLSSGFRGYNGYRGSGYRYYRGGYGFGFGGYGYGPYYGYGYYPWTGYGYSYWPSYSDNYSDSYYPDTYGYSPYNPSPNVTVVYPPAQAAPPVVYNTGAAHPVGHSYDQYGQEIQPAGSSAEARSPIYLIALNSGVIYPASAYRVEGNVLHYSALDRQEKQVSLDQVDRSLTLRLNRERRVPMNLPGQ